MLLDKTEIQITDSKSILSFETEGGTYCEVWDRYIAIEGKKAFHIGNVCGTCSFFFERLEGANKSIDPEKVVKALNKGVRKIKTSFLDDLKKIIPDGKYIVLLSEVLPVLTYPGDEKDYFSHEQVELWGMDAFWGMPHFPKTEYYRLTTKNINEDTGYYEFLIPTFPHNWLDKKRLAEYRKMLRKGHKPSMVTLGIFDTNQPADWEGEKKITNHWCLAHYLVDGHHKAYAAALERKPVTMISFLAIEQGISSEENIEKMLTLM